MSGLQPASLTWAALLGKWVEFAQSSLALPHNTEGNAWRASVPGIITLQAVTCALREVGDLPPDEHALALDKAEMLIRQHDSELRTVWNNALPPMVTELIDDALHTLHAAGSSS